MPFLNEQERQTLRQICDTFVPKLVEQDGMDQRLADFCARDVEVAHQIEATAERLGGETGKRQLKRFVGLIRSGIVNGFMAGIWDRFSELSLDERTRVLNAWATSRMNSARKSFQAIKRLALFSAYASPTEDGINPTWPGASQTKTP